MKNSRARFFHGQAWGGQGGELGLDILVTDR